MNALVEPTIIEALYRASAAGVDVDLIVRGICCLRPGVPGTSERIRVRSIVGRFLEHARVFHFANNGADELYCSSADWMGRNLFRRIEVAFPIVDAELKQRLRSDLERGLADNTLAWEMDSDGHYWRHTPASSPTPNEIRDSQTELLLAYAAGAIDAGAEPAD
jgi:polyphosphate kinase